MKKKKLIDLYIDNLITTNEFIKYVECVRENNPYDELGITQDEYLTYIRLGTIAIEDIKKNRILKRQIIDKAKLFFKEEIAENHIQNTKKLTNLSKFNLNPFLDKYRAQFFTGNSSPESIARALVYPRILGTSINTTFGSKIQKFCSTILDGYASTTSGIDIEFTDFIDGRKKFCQVKAGPNTINNDDVKSISDHFQSIKNLARTNNLNINLNDLVVGVFYGEPHELSGHYKKISSTYPVYIGKEFWFRLTGDENFYTTLTDAIGEVASEFDSSELIEDTISKLAKEIEKALEDLKT